MLTRVELTAKYGDNYAPATVRERDRYWRDAFGVTYDEMMGEDFSDYEMDRLECESYFEYGYDDEEDES